VSQKLSYVLLEGDQVVKVLAKGQKVEHRASDVEMERLRVASGKLRPPSEPFKAYWYLFQYSETLRFASRVHAGGIM
jgi:hypothetical protein